MLLPHWQVCELGETMFVDKQLESAADVFRQMQGLCCVHSCLDVAAVFSARELVDTVAKPSIVEELTETLHPRG